jgi:hypothetical protein
VSEEKRYPKKCKSILRRAAKLTALNDRATWLSGIVFPSRSRTTGLTAREHCKQPAVQQHSGQWRFNGSLFIILFQHLEKEVGGKKKTSNSVRSAASYAETCDPLRSSPLPFLRPQGANSM